MWGPSSRSVCQAVPPGWRLNCNPQASHVPERTKWAISVTWLSSLALHEGPSPKGRVKNVAPGSSGNLVSYWFVVLHSLCINSTVSAWNPFYGDPPPLLRLMDRSLAHTVRCMLDEQQVWDHSQFLVEWVEFCSSNGPSPKPPVSLTNCCLHHTNWMSPHPDS